MPPLAPCSISDISSTSILSHPFPLHPPPSPLVPPTLVELLFFSDTHRPFFDERHRIVDNSIFFSNVRQRMCVFFCRLPWFRFESDFFTIAAALRFVPQPFEYSSPENSLFFLIIFSWWFVFIAGSTGQGYRQESSGFKKGIPKQFKGLIVLSLSLSLSLYFFSPSALLIHFLGFMKMFVFFSLRFERGYFFFQIIDRYVFV